MSLQVGIVGLPNAGKSTLFNALTGADAAVANYPFTTIEPNHGIVIVNDPRLDRAFALAGSAKVVPATVEFVDIAGLVKGANQGEGLGNQFLGHIRDVDALVLVLRCFHDPDVAHVSGGIDPIADLDTLQTELMLADLAALERRTEKVQTAAKAHPRDFADELALLARLRDYLNHGGNLRSLSHEEKDRAWLREVNLLTSKPRLFVANIGEEDLPDGNELSWSAREAAAVDGSGCVILCAQLEADLASWSPEEAQAYRADLGLTTSGRDALIHAGYRLLDLITFFTTTGVKEVRAWPLPAGTTALEAAGRIHSDIQRGFIRAEVVSFADLDRLGSFAAVREKGLLRLEGRDYIVQDGDIIHFRFNV